MIYSSHKDRGPISRSSVYVRFRKNPAYITAAANLFSAEEYDIVVINRGTVVMHELRIAMGREALIKGLSRFYEKGLSAELLGEYDLVDAFNEVTGGDWESFITEWLFNVDEYVGQEITFYE